MLLNRGARNGKLKQSIENKGHFPFNQMSGLNFRQHSVANGAAFFQNFQKRGQPREVYPNFRNFFSRKFSFHSTLLPEFLEFSVNGSHFGNSTVSGFLETFPKIAHHLLLFPNFRKFWLNGPQLVIGPGFKLGLFPIFRSPVPRSIFTTFVAFECNLFRRSSVKPMFTPTTLDRKGGHNVQLFCVEVDSVRYCAVANVHYLYVSSTAQSSLGRAEGPKGNDK